MRAKRVKKVAFPVQVKKLKTYDVGIDGITYTVQAHSRGNAFSLAVSKHREDKGLPASQCIMTQFVREQAIEVGATA